MNDLVPAGKIEDLVGAKRHPTLHLGRAVSSAETFYVLHSQECFDSGIDLRECPYSQSMERNGIDLEVWVENLDRPVALMIDSSDMVAPEASTI